MKTVAKNKFALTLVVAFAGVSALFGGNCKDGFCAISGVYAAQVNRGPIAPKRDPELEKEAAHHLDVAWQYFKRKPNKGDTEAIKRSNKAIISRLDDILGMNQNFARMDEVHFLYGEVHLRDANQEEALKSFLEVAEKYPDSKFNKDAKKRVAELQTSATKKSDDKQEGKKKS